MNPLLGKHFVKALIDAGIVPDETTSVVIQANVGEVVMIYVRQIGDERLLNVTHTLDGAVVSREEDSQKRGDQTCS